MARIALLFVQRDAAPGLGLVFGPQVGRNYRQGNPAQTQGKVMQPFQKIDDGHFALLEYRKKVIGGRFQ